MSHAENPHRPVNRLLLRHRWWVAGLLACIMSGLLLDLDLHLSLDRDLLNRTRRSRKLIYSDIQGQLADAWATMWSFMAIVAPVLHLVFLLHWT